ncbi:MAG: ABC transporter ATP-binding protein [Paracoccaceae bacterium]|nr:ABC transporter ATP-binding protein [Paracoccaceae bacterium]
MLEVSGLWTKAGGPVSLNVRPGEIVALRGPSGSGKSLILRAIADLDATEGSVLLNGIPRDRIPAPEWRKKVALVPAESGWWADRVGDHFADPDAARPLITSLGLDADALEWEVNRLSTGERQRLAIARALVHDPQVWLLDEPTAALDGNAARSTENVIREGCGRGAAILMVTHDPAQADRFATRSLFLADGRLSEMSAVQ